MLFPAEEMFAYVLVDLADVLSAHPSLPSNPLPCDRWIARSALQKAVRRGQGELAVRALATLVREDRRNVWRHLIVIALEDVGVGNADLCAQIIAAQRDTGWRQSVGGDWYVLAGIVQLLAASNHCQANCDLLLKAKNDPACEALIAASLEANWPELRDVITDSSIPLTERAIAALGMGGGLAPSQQISDPHGLYEILAELGHFGHIVAMCRKAWKASHNPMALLMPLLWQSQSKLRVSRANDDPVGKAQFLNGVPGYALDQFTRVGNDAFRRFLKSDNELKFLLDEARVPSSRQVRAIGDVFFLFEGGLVVRRDTWPEAEALRRPSRWLPAVSTLGYHLPNIIVHCQARVRQVEIARAATYNSI